MAYAVCLNKGKLFVFKIFGNRGGCNSFYGNFYASFIFHIFQFQLGSPSPATNDAFNTITDDDL